MAFRRGRKNPVSKADEKASTEGQAGARAAVQLNQP